MSYLCLGIHKHTSPTEDKNVKTRKEREYKGGFGGKKKVI